MMDVNGTRDWLRWTLFFSLFATGTALLNGFSDMLNDAQPLSFMLGFVLFQVIIFVVPGLIIGGMAALATKKHLLGLKIFVVINAALIFLFLFGMVREMGR